MGHNVSALKRPLFIYILLHRSAALGKTPIQVESLMLCIFFSIIFNFANSRVLQRQNEIMNAKARLTKEYVLRFHLIVFHNPMLYKLSCFIVHNFRKVSTLSEVK